MLPCCTCRKGMPQLMLGGHQQVLKKIAMLKIKGLKQIFSKKDCSDTPGSPLANPPTPLLAPPPSVAGGYMVYSATTTKYVFAMQPGDVFWCTADCGWITGHSYLTYGGCPALPAVAVASDTA